jgi:murein DD-endopeptidase MepM/ murein hydrolase activator NlpD
MGENVRWVLAVAIVACLSACEAASVSPTSSAIPSPTSRPTNTALPTVTVSFTVTVLPSAIFTTTPTVTQTLTASRSKNPHAYVFPVQPQSAADFGEGGHAYPATDIFAPVGSEFVAVTRGVVDFVSDEDLWNPESGDEALAGGLSVAIIGDDGVRYYGSHLLEVLKGIRPGLRVEAGQLLGWVGNSGNARTTQPHLHFGISHPTYPEDWRTRRGELDPYPYLVAWSRGEDVTPRFPTATPTRS